MNQSSTRTIITGINGYLASNLVNYLKTNQINSFGEIIGINRDQADLSQNLTTTIAEYFYNADLLIHTAYLGNFSSEKFFLENILKINPKIKLIYFSSSAVYGENPQTNKETDQCKPINDYGQAKLKTEGYIIEHFHNHLILRISNPYGKEKYKKTFYKIIQDEFIKPGEILIKINADQPQKIIRDFIYIDDSISMIINLIVANQSGTFNISSGKGTSLEDFTLAAAKEENIDPERIKFEYLGYKPGDIRCSILDCNKSIAVITKQTQ